MEYFTELKDVPMVIDITIRDYVRILFRYKWVIFISFFTVVAAVFFGLELKTPVYEAEVKMLITAEKQVEAPYYRELIGYRNAEITLTQSEIVKSEPVLDRVVRYLRLHERPLDYERMFCSAIKSMVVKWRVDNYHLKFAHLPDDQKRALRFRSSVEELKNSITIKPVRDTNLFTITVKDFSPLGASIIANVVSRSYVIFDLEQQLVEVQLKYGDKHPSVQQLQDSIDALKQTLNGKPISNLEAIGPASVKIVDQAQIPLEPIGQPRKIFLILAAIMGAFLGIMLAFVFDYLDQSFKSPYEIESYLKMPFLGSLSKAKFATNVLLLKKAKRKNLYSRLYSTLAEQIYLLTKDKRVKTIMFTSSLIREGSTTVVANLGLLLANKLRHKVLIVDANLRNSNMLRKFKIANDEQLGLSDVLSGSVSCEEAIQRFSSQLSILPSGATEFNPVTLFDSPEMIQFIAKVKSEYDIVLFDCPNLKDFKDSYVLAPSVDSIVVVVKEGSTRRQVVKNVMAPLQQHKSKIAGVILNYRTFPIPKVIYARL